MDSLRQRLKGIVEGSQNEAWYIHAETYDRLEALIQSEKKAMAMEALKDDLEEKLGEHWTGHEYDCHLCATLSGICSKHQPIHGRVEYANHLGKIEGSRMCLETVEKIEEAEYGCDLRDERDAYNQCRQDIRGAVVEAMAKLREELKTKV